MPGNRRGRQSRCPGPTAQAFPPSARAADPRTQSGQSGGQGSAVAPAARLTGDLLLPLPHLGLQQVHAAGDAVQDHALGVLILLALQRVEKPPELT